MTLVSCTQPRSLIQPWFHVWAFCGASAWGWSISPGLLEHRSLGNRWSNTFMGHTYMFSEDDIHKLALRHLPEQLVHGMSNWDRHYSMRYLWKIVRLWLCFISSGLGNTGVMMVLCTTVGHSRRFRVQGTCPTSWLRSEAFLMQESRLCDRRYIMQLHRDV